MKRMNFMFSVAAGMLLAGSALAADFTVEEMHKSLQVATDTFKTDYGATLHDSVYGIQAMKGRASSRVKLFYRENDEAKSVEYFCHYHDPDVMDCHEH